MGVVLTSICVVVIVVLLTTIVWKKRSRGQRWTMEQHDLSRTTLFPVGLTSGRGLFLTSGSPSIC